MNAERETRRYTFLFYVLLIILTFNIYYVGRHVDFMCKIRYRMTPEEYTKMHEQGIYELYSDSTFKIIGYVLPQISSMLLINPNTRKNYAIYSYAEQMEYRSWWVQSFNSKWHWIASFVVLILGFMVAKNLFFIEVNGALKVMYCIIYGYFAITFVLGIAILIFVFFMSSRKGKK